MRPFRAAFRGAPNPRGSVCLFYCPFALLWGLCAACVGLVCDLCVLADQANVRLCVETAPTEPLHLAPGN